MEGGGLVSGGVSAVPSESFASIDSIRAEGGRALAALDRLFGALRADTAAGEWVQAWDSYLALRGNLEAAGKALRRVLKGGRYDVPPPPGFAATVSYGGSARRGPRKAGWDVHSSS